MRQVVLAVGVALARPTPLVCAVHPAVADPATGSVTAGGGRA